MRKILLIIAFGLLNLQNGNPSLAETPEELLQRLDRGRDIDARNEQLKRETLEWKQRREAEEYSRTWKKYDNFQVNVKQWRQQKDGIWIAPAKFSIEPNDSTPAPEEPIRSLGTQIHHPPPRRFDATLEELVRDGIISKEEGCRVARHFSQDCNKILSGQWIGVNCISLHVNKKPEAKDWGKWERPSPDSPEEKLLIDRCAKSGI